MKKIILFLTFILGLSLVNSSFAWNFSNTAIMWWLISCSISSTWGLRCSSSAINLTVPSWKFIWLDSNHMGTICAIDTLWNVKCFWNDQFYLQDNHLLDSTYIDVWQVWNDGYILSINKNKKLSYFWGNFLIKNFDSNLDFVAVASINYNNACWILDNWKITCWWSSSFTYNNLFSKNNYTRIVSNNVSWICALTLDWVVQCSNWSIYNDKIYKDLSMWNGYYMLLDNSWSLSCYWGWCSYFSLPTDNLWYLKIFASKNVNYCAIKKDNTTFCSWKDDFNMFNPFIWFNDYQFLNPNTSTSSNSSQTCINYQPQTFDYVFNREFSVYLKNENDYYISSSERNLSYRNKNNKDLLKINFWDFDFVYHYDNNLDRIFDVNLMYKSQFNWSLKVNNWFFDDNEIEIKIYSSSWWINFFRLKSDQDYEFELLGLSDTKKTKTSIWKFKTNTDYHLSEDFYSLFVKLDWYTFNWYNIYWLTLINYTKKYKSEQKTCYDSDTQKFTIDWKEVDYDVVSNLDETWILNIVKDKNSIFNKKVTQDILNWPSYKQYDTWLNTSVNVDDYFSSCNKDLSNVNIWAFQWFVSLWFWPVKVPLTDITLNFYPFSWLTCPLKSVYYIKNDLFSKF